MSWLKKLFKRLFVHETSLPQSLKKVSCKTTGMTPEVTARIRVEFYWRWVLNLEERNTYVTVELDDGTRIGGNVRAFTQERICVGGAWIDYSKINCIYK